MGVLQLLDRNPVVQNLDALYRLVCRHFEGNGCHTRVFCLHNLSECLLRQFSLNSNLGQLPTQTCPQMPLNGHTVTSLLYIQALNS